MSGTGDGTVEANDLHWPAGRKMSMGIGHKHAFLRVALKFDENTRLVSALKSLGGKRLALSKAS